MYTDVLHLIRKLLPFARRAPDPQPASIPVSRVEQDTLASKAIANFRASAWRDGEDETRPSKWLDISVEGFAEQQRGRPLAHLVNELWYYREPESIKEWLATAGEAEAWAFDLWASTGIYAAGVSPPGDVISTWRRIRAGAYA